MLNDAVILGVQPGQWAGHTSITALIPSLQSGLFLRRCTGGLQHGHKPSACCCSRSWATPGWPRNQPTRRSCSSVTSSSHWATEHAGRRAPRAECPPPRQRPLPQQQRRPLWQQQPQPKPLARPQPRAVPQQAQALALAARWQPEQEQEQPEQEQHKEQQQITKQKPAHAPAAPPQRALQQLQPLPRAPPRQRRGPGAPLCAAAQPPGHGPGAPAAPRLPGLPFHGRAHGHGARHGARHAAMDAPRRAPHGPRRAPAATGDRRPARGAAGPTHEGPSVVL